MASGKGIKVEATYEQDTKNGKRRYGLEGAGVTGTIYLSPKAGEGVAEEFSFTVPKGDE